MVMEKENREKAVEQALASLRIDGIQVSEEYLSCYREKHDLAPKIFPQLVLKRSIINGK